MLRLYRGLLALYPATYRDRFGAEMSAVFEEVYADATLQKPAARLALCLRETSGLLSGALREHLRLQSSAPISFPFPIRRIRMSKGFRFPKSTAFLMLLILAGVVIAINQGENISVSLATDPSIARSHVPHFNFVQDIAMMLGTVYAIGVAVWGVLFVLHRSGTHRLDDLSTEQK